MRLTVSLLLTALTAGLISPVIAAAPEPSKTGVAQLTRQASQSYAEHQYDAAASAYEQALKLAGSSLPARARVILLSNLGAAYREGKKLNEAKEAFKKAIGVAEKEHIESDPAAQTAMRQYAFLLRKTGQNLDADLMENRANNVQAPAVMPVPSGTTAMTMGAGAAPIVTTAGTVQSTSEAPDEFVQQKASSASIQVGSGRKSVRDLTIDQWKQVVDEHTDNAAAWHMLAYKYMSLSDWRNAISTFQQIKLRFPDQFSDMRRELADCYERADQVQSAIDELRVAINEKPNSSGAYLQLGSLFMARGEIKPALEVFDDYLSRFPDDKSYREVSDYVASLKKSSQTASSSPTQPSRNERTYNWPTSFFPLKVFVAGADSVSMKNPESGFSGHSASDVIQSACQEWTQATAGKVSFVFVPRAQDANIEIGFTNDAAAMENAAAAGVTKWTGRGELPKVRMYLLATDRDGDKLVPERLMETTLHELGHALGLEHSNDVNDIMYYQMHRKAMINISQTDAKRIIVLYTR